MVVLWSRKSALPTGCSLNGISCLSLMLLLESMLVWSLLSGPLSVVLLLSLLLVVLLLWSRDCCSSSSVECDVCKSPDESEVLSCVVDCRVIVCTCGSVVV